MRLTACLAVAVAVAGPEPVRRLWPRGVAGLGLLLLAAAAAAQTTVHYREGQRVDPRDVQQILSAPPAAPQGRTRSIRLLADEPVALAAEAASAEPASALSLPVHFEFDSAAILPAAREQLDALADGIKLLPPSRRIVIEGHTDASGSEQYNDQLSLRRAEAVKRYLVQHHGLEARRMQATGLGERHPIAGLEPEAADQRRVQFRGG
jgi:OOP family OmpA-OmpF porin